VLRHLRVKKAVVNKKLTCENPAGIWNVLKMAVVIFKLLAPEMIVAKRQFLEATLPKILD
jgi:hypothetical protein